MKCKSLNVEGLGFGVGVRLILMAMLGGSCVHLRIGVLCDLEFSDSQEGANNQLLESGLFQSLLGSSPSG